MNKTPFELHQQIADSSVGVDKVTVSIMMAQLGSISNCLDRMFLEGPRGYNAEIEGEMADLVFHLDVFAKRRGKNLDDLQTMGAERYEERRSDEAMRE